MRQLSNADELRILLVDDEPKVLRGIDRSIATEEEDWEVFLANGGEEGLESLKEDMVDVVVSDLRMPQMDGEAFLSRVKELYPDVVRFVLSGYADQELMLKATSVAHRHLIKPCESKSMVATIRQVVETRIMLGNDDVAAIVNGAGELHRGQGAIQELLKTMDDPDCDLGMLKSIVEKNPTVDAGILRVANSAFFGSGGRIETLDEALSILGVDFVRSFSLMELSKASLVLSPVLEKVADGIFEHCVRSSCFVRHVLKKLNRFKQMSALSSVSLLHDLGKLLFLSCMGHRYVELMHESGDRKIPLWQLEKREFGCHHGAVAAYLFELWGLPESIVRAVAFHHEPSRLDADSAELAGLMHLCNVAAHLSEQNTMYVGDAIDQRVVGRFCVTNKFLEDIVLEEL